MSWIRVSPPRSLDLRRFSFSRVLMNFLGVFQVVFLICKAVASSASNIGRYGRMRFDMKRDWGMGKSKP